MQLGSIAGVVLGAFLALLSTKFLLDFVESRLTVYVNPFLLSYVSFLLLYILFFMSVKYLGYNCSNMAKKTKFEIIDNVLGFILGVFIAYIILLLVIMLLDKQSVFAVKQVYSDSFVYKNIFTPSIDFLKSLSGKIPDTLPQ